MRTLIISDENINFKPKSTWQPPKDDPVLENYLSLLEKEVMSVSPEGRNFSNLSSSEQLSLKQLKSDGSIVIKEADKGSAVVVWNRGITLVRLTDNKMIGRFMKR